MMTIHRFIEQGILNINKPEDWTSYDVVRKIKKLTRIQKVGHAGTLDPFATGVLLLALEKATKQISALMDLEKEYIGRIELGVVTDSLDVTGKVLQTYPTYKLTPTAIEKTCKAFIGEIEQVPPAYSAVKINGVRAYQLARAGKAVPLKPRRIKILELAILDIQIPFVTIKVVCSKGTYIRALARDIGEKLNTGGYLKSLVRTRIGQYRIEDALTIEQIERMARF